MPAVLDLCGDEAMQGRVAEIMAVGGQPAVRLRGHETLNSYGYPAQPYNLNQGLPGGRMWSVRHEFEAASIDVASDTDVSFGDYLPGAVPQSEYAWVTGDEAGRLVRVRGVMQSEAHGLRLDPHEVQGRRGEWSTIAVQGYSSHVHKELSALATESEDVNVVLVGWEHVRDGCPVFFVSSARQAPRH